MTARKLPDLSGFDLADPTARAVAADLLAEHGLLRLEKVLRSGREMPTVAGRAYLPTATPKTLLGRIEDVAHQVRRGDHLISYTSVEFPSAEAVDLAREGDSLKAAALAKMGRLAREAWAAGAAFDRINQACDREVLVLEATWNNKSWSEEGCDWTREDFAQRPPAAIRVRFKI